MSIVGSLFRGLVLAVLVAVVSCLAGAVIAVFACNSGSCGIFAPFAEVMIEPAPGFGGGIRTAAVLGALFFLGLFIVLTPREPVTFLAAVFALLIGLLGFLLWVPQRDPEPLPEPEPEPTPAAPLALAEPEEPVCEEGAFLEGELCFPCEEEVTRRQAPKLAFEAVETRAHWTYASAGLVSIDGQNIRTTDFVSNLASETSLCDAPAVLVLGSASSDGALTRNELRAAQRAKNLASAVEAACGEETRVMAISLGQSSAEDDASVDRSVTIVKLNPKDGVEMTPRLLYKELGHALAEGEPSSPLIERRPQFSRPWLGVDAEPLTIDMQPRPIVTAQVTVAGAPASCDVDESSSDIDMFDQAVDELSSIGDAEGLDQSSTISQ